MFLYGGKLFQERIGLSYPSKSNIDRIKVAGWDDLPVLYSYLYLLTDFKVDKERLHEKKIETLSSF